MSESALAVVIAAILAVPIVVPVMTVCVVAIIETLRGETRNGD